MKDFEKLLTDLPKPAVEVPAFKQELWRELRHTQVPPAQRGLRLALAVAASLAIGFGLLATAFVIDPDLPAGARAWFVGQPDTTSRPGIGDLKDVLGAGDVSLAELQQALEGTEASIDLDREFIQDWSSQQARPVNVRSMEAESVYTIRKFELSDGKRVLVFTELGSGRQSFRAVTDSPVSTQIF